jgi:malonate transporter
VSAAVLLLPDLLLIVGGYALARLTRWGGEFWAGVEKLTYFVLFPALLFYSNARARIDMNEAGPLLLTGFGAVAAGVALGMIGKLIFRPPRPVFGAGVQCAFRFNSYIVLALATRFGGDHGLGLAAALIGAAVPVVNVISVIGLAGGRDVSVARELATNPLIIACVAGIAWGALGLPLPEVTQTLLSRLGGAALVLGLIAVGAALNPAPPRANKGFIAYLLAVKLLAVPVVAWIIGRSLGLPSETFVLAVAFAAAPTAASAYILAVRLGGDAQVASTLVSYSVVLSLVTLPAWLAIVR